jgi:hypothetical protein
MTSDEVSARILALTEDQRDHLQHLLVVLIQIIENPKLQGFVMHTLPSPEDSEIEGVLLHTVNCGMEEVEEMMCNLLAARNAAAAASPNNTDQRH